MKLHASLLATACALALSACGGEPAQTPDTTAATPPAPIPAEDDKVDSATVPEAPWGQVPADGTTTNAGDPGESAGNGAATPGAETTPATGTTADGEPATEAAADGGEPAAGAT